VGLVNGAVAFDGPPSALDDAVLQQVYGDEAVDAHGSDEVVVGD
jgi:ABC-type phosphate/phosphonate transport system ATPase subunit